MAWPGPRRLLKSYQIPKSLPIDVGLLVAVGFLASFLLLGTSSLRPYNAAGLDTSPALLPLYLMLSLARLGLAYAVALLLALAVGNWAARSAFARRLILPILDVLQSVPILGFFPVAVGFFIALFRGSGLGVEAAAVFLIFTSMFWNMAFGVYESLITIPEELTAVSNQLGLHGRLRWSRLYLPAMVPGLLYNSLVSWANGWYFLIASEIIAVGPARYTLPGLGSYLPKRWPRDAATQTTLALITLLVTTVAMHLLLWSPLATWAERFQLDETGDRPRMSARGAHSRAQSDHALHDPSHRDPGRAAGPGSRRAGARRDGPPRSLHRRAVSRSWCCRWAASSSGAWRSCSWRGRCRRS